MRRVWLGLAAALALAGCNRPVGEDGTRGPSLPRPNGVWSAREALQGPMAVFGPLNAPEGVLTVTCRSTPSTLIVTLLSLPQNARLSGDMVLRAGRRTFHAPLAVKDGSAEADFPADAALTSALSSADDLRVETPSAPKAGLDTGRPDAALRGVLAACR